jgi:hypothetical protein
MTVKQDDLPSRGDVLVRGGLFVALLLASQQVIVWLLTGEWGGDPSAHPLWIGPVSAGLAMFNTIGTFVAARLQADVWTQAEQHDQEQQEAHA